MADAMRKLTVIGLLAVVALAQGGCAHMFASHSKSADTGSVLIVQAEETPFYHFGPKQGKGPDRQLPKNTRVTVIRHGFGYSKVRLADGQQGFVANDDMIRAPETMIAQTEQADPADEASALPPTPEVTLPTADSSPSVEPSATPAPLIPQ
jgi:hypothetical protein